MRVLFFILITVFSNLLSAQVAEQRCNTEDADSAIVVNFPWYGNNELLLSYVDSIEAPFSCTNCRWGDGVSRTAYQIPVNIVIYEKTGHPNISNEEAEDYIASVNDIFKQNNVFIHLYPRCYITRVLNSDRAKIDNIIEEQTVFMSDNKSRSINLHFVSETYDNWSGSAKPPWLMVDYSIIVNTEKTTEDRRNTTAHEIGHAFGLLHTFNKNNCRNDCWQEPVSRTRTQEGKCLFTIGKKKCSVNGDCLCDTDADVLESKKWKVFKDNASCINETYNVSISNDTINCLKYDNYGDQWYKSGYTNAMRNLMSYFKDDCRQEITKMQRGVMYKYVEKRGIIPATNNHVDFYKNADLDAYEPDNFWFSENININNQRKKIDVNSQQYHTFHYAYNNSNNWEACDVDWVYFYSPTAASIPFIIQTMEVSGKPKPDTKITLYPVNSSGVLGAALETKDDISSSNLFSKITRSLNNGYYAVKIENKVTSTSDTRSKGHYYISVDECYDKSSIQLVASGFVCSNPKTASLLNVPTGSQYNVQWTTQNLTIIGSSTSNSVNYTRSTPGTGKLTATITSTTGCIPYVLEKVITTKYPTRILTSPFGIKSTCDDLALEELVFPIRLDPGTQATFTLTYLNGSDLDIVDVEWAYDCGSIVSQDVFTTFLGLRSDIKVNVGYGFCGELKARPVNSCGEKGPWKVKDLVHTTTPCSNGGGWSLKIAPNPSQNQIRFELDEEKLSLYESKYLEETIQIIITDSKGNISYSDKRPFGDNTIDIGKLKAGLYHLTLLIGEQVMNGKFTKVE